MTREEEIQKAAIEARCAVATSVSGDNYSSIDDLPFIEGKLSYDGLVEEAFTKGAEWADTHPAKKQTIWHTPDIEPEPETRIIYTDIGGDEFVFQTVYRKNRFFGMMKGWEVTVENYKIAKWAYIDDIINL